MFFFFNDTATPEIYPLSLHDALPIFCRQTRAEFVNRSSFEPSPEKRYSSITIGFPPPGGTRSAPRDRKSTRLNSSHSQISYAVFCLKKKNVTSPPHSMPSRTRPCALA